MKDIVRYGFTLGIICVLAGGLLATVNTVTKPKIIAQAVKQEEESLAQVLPQAERFEPVKSSAGEIIYYKAYAKDNKPAGAAFKASAKGYSGIIETMAGMSRDGRISSIKILSQSETPGLGNRIAEAAFLFLFANKDILGLNQIQAIAGATISSKAVIDSVKKKAEEIKGLIENVK